MLCQWPPSESPLGHLTCKGNEYFVDGFVPSHIEPSFLKSTLVTLDLSCMEVRALGPAEVDWADNGERMLSGKVTPRQLSFHTPCLSGGLARKDARLFFSFFFFNKDSLFCSADEVRRKKRKREGGKSPWTFSRVAAAIAEFFFFFKRADAWERLGENFFFFLWRKSCL